MKKILVTGTNGQLGSCLKIKSKEEETLDFVFLDSQSLDITNNDQIKQVFDSNDFDYCVNCAAYTAVDKAEQEKEKAYAINVSGARKLAKACKRHSVVLIHISTDFVFDGTKDKPYTEDDKTNPVSVYGKTKRDGELEIIDILDTHYIIRTSWLYSEFGNNFVKTMLKLSQERDELSVVTDQIGAPTYALDLADVIILFIKKDLKNYGLYHFCNEGSVSWYSFAQQIFKITNSEVLLLRTDSKKYLTNAKRPKYSVLSTNKLTDFLEIKPSYWKESLDKCLKAITFAKNK